MEFRTAQAAADAINNFHNVEVEGPCDLLASVCASVCTCVGGRVPVWLVYSWRDDCLDYLVCEAMQYIMQQFDQLCC